MLGVVLFLLPVVAGLIALAFVAPIPQPESYHNFADQRRLLGIPNFWDVVSNLPFAVAGALGLVPLPAIYWAWIVGFLILYCTLTHFVKTWFFHRFGVD